MKPNWKSPPVAVYTLAAALLLGGVPAGAARASDLNRKLLEQAPTVLRYLKDKGYQNVGVLKFRVKKGDEPITDHAGTLNLSLADRLERALILADDLKQPVGIIHDASAVAARLRGANHLTREGRQVLFQGRYPLAWGGEEVKPDAFLTGVVQISSDLRDLTVGILAFDTGGTSLERVTQFKATRDAGSLIETGESFLLRGAFDAGQEQPSQAKAVETAERVKKEKDAYPLQDQAAPGRLEIYYDDARVPLEVRGGEAQVPEPREGQKVTFVLRRTAAASGRIGVVLKVNGENTLFKERQPDVACRKWILGPGDPPITVRGYQLTGKTAEAFRILSGAESKQKEIDYGGDVGTIMLSVFREKQAARHPPDLPPDDNAEDLAALTRGVFPGEKPKNLAALKEQLRADASRGLIGQGQQVGADIQHVSFKPDPTPVMAATIRYYRP
jgi:hypothetical protein